MSMNNGRNWSGANRLQEVLGFGKGGNMPIDHGVGRMSRGADGQGSQIEVGQRGGRKWKEDANE